MVNDYDELSADQLTNRPSSGRSKLNRSVDEQKGGISDNSFSFRLFRVYLWVGKERNTSKFAAIAVMVLLFAQVYDLLLSPEMHLPFSGSLYNVVSNIFDIVRIYPAVIRFGGPGTYYFFLFAPLVIACVYVAMLVLIDGSLRASKGRSVQLLLTLKCLQFMSTAFFWVLLVPTIDFFISVYECDSSGYHKVDQSLQCWSGLHAFYCALFAFGLALFIGLAVAISLLYNESRPSHTDALTRLDINQELYLAMYRIVLVVVSHYTADYSTFQWLALALHALICSHLVKSYQLYLPYYQADVSITYGALCLAYAWVVANSVLVKALASDAIHYEGQAIVVCVGFVLMWPTARYMRARRVKEVMVLKQQEKLKDDLELDQFATNFQLFMAEESQESSMMFLGFLYTHREECQQANCPLRSNQHLYQPLTDTTSKRELFPSKDRILHQHFVNSVFLDYQRAHANSLTAQHHTSYAQFLFCQMGNVHMALIELNLATKASASNSSSVQQVFTIFKYKQLIEEHLYKKFKKTNQNNLRNLKIVEEPAGPPGANGGLEPSQIQAYASLDVSIVITFENLFSRFEKVIEQSATDHIEFWSHLDSNMIDLNVINKLGLNIINRTKRVNDLWAQLIRINPSYPNALYLYGNYLQQIKNDFDQGEDFKQQYQAVKRLKQMEDYENQFDIMFAEDTAVVIMNGSREQQGKIMKTNQGIQKLFGYSMFEVQGHDVNILMPPVLALKHQQFLDNYFRTGKERVLNTCLESFAMYRTGVIFPVHIVIKPVPSLRNDIQYIGMIKSANRDYEYILTDENGRIDTISEGVISLLKLPISFFKEHEIPIQVVVPELCEVQRHKNPITGQHEIATHFDAWTGQKDLKYVIPKNFSNAGGRHHFGVAQQTVAPKGNIEVENLDGRQRSIKDGKPQAPQFVGMRSPESLKSICSMFKNAEHKAQPEKYKNNLMNHVNYSNPDFEKVLKTDIQLRLYAGGEVRMKVFKIFFNRKKKKNNDAGRGGSPANASETNSAAESAAAGPKVKEAADTLMHRHGLTPLQTLIDETIFQKYLELLAQFSLNQDPNKVVDLSADIRALRSCLERQKKLRVDGKIHTPEEYDELELDRMIANLAKIEKQVYNKSNKEAGEVTRISNPIAAAFAHRLAAFVRTQTVNTGRYFDQRESGKSKHGEGEEEVKGGGPSPRGSGSRGSKGGASPRGGGASPSHERRHSMSGSRGNASGAKETLELLNPRGGSPHRVTGESRPKQQRDFMVDFFVKNNFSSTVFVPAAHNELVKNLQSKFKATQVSDNAAKKGLAESTMGAEADGAANKQLAEDLNDEQKSVKLEADDGGSVSNDSKSLLGQLRVLRNALYENYSPQSIENLKYSARFVMVVLISMTIASFLFSKDKYDQLKENFRSVQQSQVRMQSVTGIATATRFSLMMNSGMVDRYRYGPTDDYLAKMRADLNTKALNLQIAQSNLSTTVYDFTPDNKYAINANNITLYYNTYEDVGQSRKANIWTAAMQLAVAAYKIKDMPLESFNEDHMSGWFILRNAMNNVLVAVSSSTQSILNDTKLLSDDNKRILMILLLVASGCLLLSMLIIMPVVTKVHKDKDKLLSLFLQIDQEDVKEQLKRCREFFSTFHSDDKVGAQNANDAFDIEDEDAAKEDDEGDKKVDKEKQGEEGGKEGKSKFTRKNKKLKKYSTNYLMLLFKFFFVITFLESYFLYQYFQSDNFLGRSLSMIKEAASITNRSFNNFLLYQILVEIVATNGTAQVFNQGSTQYIEGYLDGFNIALEGFLQVHSDNVGKHDADFNSFFDNLVYKSVCSSVGSYFANDDQRALCSSYLGGVLEKGLYSANLAYWDDMREIRDAFFKSDRSADYLRSLINSPRVIAIEQLNEIYFATAYQVLLDKQNESIAVQFEHRNKEIVALFSVYLALLVLSYFFVWGRFVESMRHSLWVTKSMLAIIPIEVIEKVKVVKDFLLETSQAAVRSMQD